MSNKIIFHPQKAGDEYTKLSQISKCQGLECEVKKEFKESHTVKNKPARGRKQKILKTLDLDFSTANKHDITKYHQQAK